MDRFFTYFILLGLSCFVYSASMFAVDRAMVALHLIETDHLTSLQITGFIFFRTIVAWLFVTPVLFFFVILNEVFCENRKILTNRFIGLALIFVCACSLRLGIEPKFFSNSFVGRGRFYQEALSILAAVIFFWWLIYLRNRGDDDKFST
jgi:hypothetical protein